MDGDRGAGAWSCQGPSGWELSSFTGIRVSASVRLLLSARAAADSGDSVRHLRVTVAEGRDTLGPQQFRAAWHWRPARDGIVASRCSRSTLHCRAPAARCALSENTQASLLCGWIVTAGRMCWIRVGLGSMLDALVASINRADILAILPFIARRGQTSGLRAGPAPYPLNLALQSSLPLPPPPPPRLVCLRSCAISARLRVPMTLSEARSGPRMRLPRRLKDRGGPRRRRTGPDRLEDRGRSV
jgi:hypothetical protein